MRFLRVFRFVFINTWRVWHISRAKAFANFRARCGHRFRRHINTVGPHIGDVARLIQPLRRRHTGLRAHAIFAAGFLL